MGHDRNAPKRPINVSLNEDLVRRARAHTRNLSATLETLLQHFVAAEEARQRDADQAATQIIDSFNSFHLQHGLLSDEFSGL